MIISYNNIVVLKHYRSRNVTKYYKFALQRRPVGSIDLRGVTTGKSFMYVWKESIGLKGTFSLVARDLKGRLAKEIAVVVVTAGGVEFMDRRCSLAKMMEIKRRKAVAKKVVDYTM